MAIDKPWGTTLPPKRHVKNEEAELDRELAEIQQIEVRRIRNEERHRDPIGDLIGAKLCQRNKSFWFIQYRSSSITATHFYPEVNVAIDVFETIGPNEKKEIDFKRSAFRVEGIRYAALDYSMEASELLPQIKKVRLWPLSRNS